MIPEDEEDEALDLIWIPEGEEDEAQEEEVQPQDEEAQDEEAQEDEACNTP